MRAIYEQADVAGLRPVRDDVMGWTLTDCPVCHGETQDELEIHRPVKILDEGTIVCHYECSSGLELRVALIRAGVRGLAA